MKHNKYLYTLLLLPLVGVSTFLTPKKASEVNAYSVNTLPTTISLNDYIGFDKEGNEVSLIEVLKDDSKDIIDDINIKDDIELLKKHLNILNNREKEIIIKRYGLNNTEEKTQKEIAKELKISRSYVSRIEKRALTKMLREFLKNNN